MAINLNQTDSEAILNEAGKKAAQDVLIASQSKSLLLDDYAVMKATETR